MVVFADANFSGQFEVNYPPARFLLRGGAKFYRDAIQPLSVLKRWIVEVRADQGAIPLGDRDPSGTKTLTVETIQTFVNLKANAIGVEVLAIPFTLPHPPPPLIRIEVHQFPRSGHYLESTVHRAEIGIGQKQSRDFLATVGALNLWSE
jgi:hypothetical protein